MDVLWPILGINAVVWIVVLVGFRIQSRMLAKNLREDLSRTGERLVLGPQNGYYNRMKGFWSVKSMGVMALTDKRLIFRLPLTGGFEIPFDQVVGVSESTWFRGNYRNGATFMILKQRDGTEVAFQTRDVDRWAQEIRSLMPAHT